MTNARLPILLVVAAALCDPDGHVLLQRRAGGTQAGLWEFPGGKIESGEAPEWALVRELDEELGLAVDPGDCLPAGFASASLGDRHLLLMLFLVRRWQGEPEPRVADALVWVRPADMVNLAMPAADYPLADHLARLLGNEAV